MHSKYIYKHNYEFYRNFDKIATHTVQYCMLHETMHNAAVTIWLLLAGAGVKRRADRRGSPAQGTARVLSDSE